MHKKNSKTGHTRRTLLNAAILMAMASGQAQSTEFFADNEDWTVRFDNTVKLSYGQRIESADKNIKASANLNDGDSHFGKGDATTERADLLTELDVIHKDKMGFRISAAAWYDYAYRDLSSTDNPFPNASDNGGHLIAARDTAVAPGVTVPPGTVLVPAGGMADHSPLNNFTDRYYNGPSGELLDAFVFLNTEINNEMLLSAKLGRHTVFWGETLLNAANGINYGQSSLDLGKLYSVPGTEAKELFMPRNQLSANLTVNESFSVGAQYFLEFRNSRFPEGGTYMGPYDMALDGDNVFWLPLPSVAAIGGQSAFFGAPRGEDVTPDDQGDFGLMAKWSPEWLNGTLGFFYRNTSDTLPFFVIDAPNLHQPGLAGVAGANYFTSYGGDIDLYGISLATSLGDISVGVDINYRQNMPLASNFTIANATLAAAADAGIINGDNLIASRPEAGDTGLATGNTAHMVINGMAILSESMLWDSGVLIVEGAVSHLVDVTANEQTFKGNSSYQGVDKADDTAYTIAVNFSPVWYQVYPGLDLSMPMSFNMGIKGQSAVQLAGNEDAGSYSVGLSADLLQKYRFDLKYVDNFGDYKVCETGTDNNTPGANGAYQCVVGQITSQAGLSPLLKDRGQLTLSFKTSF